jgi:hypothetical protein
LWPFLLKISIVQAYFRGLCPNIGEFDGINVFLLCIIQKKNALPAWIFGKNILKKCLPTCLT